MKGVIYARVSSDDDRQSYERQIRDLKRWAEFLKIEIVELFAEKISGFKKTLDDRKEFKKMLQYIEKHSIKHILVSELSRLSRRYIDTVNFINECASKNICIHIEKNHMSTLDQNGEINSLTQMLVGILSSIAQEEVKTLGYRIKSGKQNSAIKGGGFNKKIYGYDKDEKGFPIINKEQAELVKKIFELTLNGIGSRTIAKYLNENYITKNWTPASVHSIIRNSFFYGKRKYNDLIIDVPPIVTEETFLKAQKFVNERKNFTSKRELHVNPFASFIRCECGARMNQIVIKSNNLDLYRCSANCGIKSVNRPFLIDEVRKVMEKNAKLTREDEQTRNKLTIQITVNETEINTNNNRIKFLKTLSDKNYERLLVGKITETEYDEHEARFDTEKKQLVDKNKNLSESNRNIKESLNNEILHYSQDLSVFKKQLLTSLEWVEIQEEIAVVKIKGWAKMIILLYRGSELLRYKNGTFNYD